MTSLDPNTDRTLAARINLYYDLHVSSSGPAPLLIALHGYGANKRQMMREAQLMAPAGFAIASLQGFHQHLKEPYVAGGPLRFGFGWLSNFRPEESIALHHQTLLDLISKLTREGVADSSQVYLVGFSQSCALNYRFAFTHPAQLKGVIGICGGLPGDWETSHKYNRSELHVFHLAGTRDEFYTPERVRDYKQQLETRTPNVTFQSYDAAHEIVPEMREDIRQWLQK
ncbi:MAG TPA: dienelactone hydrolase family protein [Pyrinomonadaceae bacterium]|nr:dienelactone hydrolase family protein [Pyrinomonadaceae bacterium]